MGLLQLFGLLITALAFLTLIAAPISYLVRFVAKLAKQPVERWDGFYDQWPKRFVILGIVGLAIGYGMMWGPSLLRGAELKRAEAANTAETAK